VFACRILLRIDIQMFPLREERYLDRSSGARRTELDTAISAGSFAQERGSSAVGYSPNEGVRSVPSRSRSVMHPSFARDA
jgi:hypothetical protein